ncbi:kinesin-like protein KIF11-A [Uloborus diversus]|uniref:kinesin-like protein KIF11-A n=1 Tax=Uloborus diversus TaxID=327109 RepID=UPI00240998E4|nr:kinesin-like protein KIF11-A [Uloborus diversus]
MPIRGSSCKVKVHDEFIPVNPDTIFRRISLLKKSDEELRNYFAFELAPFPLSLFDEEGLPPYIRENILFLHAFSGCDTTSALFRQGKKKFVKILNCTVLQQTDLLAGIIPRAMKDLFDRLEGKKVEFQIKVSFLELYNEEIYDLLALSDDLTKLKMFDKTSQKSSIVINGLRVVPVNCIEDVYTILEQGCKKRHRATTLLNEMSSRSHTVFTANIHIKEKCENVEKSQISKLNMVDLAGSENIGRSGAVDKRAREAGSINQSLLALSRVITSLCENSKHIPYRQSKLTRLLKDSLGGQTKTTLIATISPSSLHLEETQNTLNYALRAKNVKNKPEVNKHVAATSLTKVDLQIEQAQQELAQEKKKLERKRNAKKKLIQEVQEEGETLATSERVLVTLEKYSSHLHDQVHEDLTKQYEVQTEHEKNARDFVAFEDLLNAFENNLSVIFASLKEWKDDLYTKNWEEHINAVENVVCSLETFCNKNIKEEFENHLSKNLTGADLVNCDKLDQKSSQLVSMSKSFKELELVDEPSPDTYITD